MFGKNKNNRKLNILLAVLCILLLAAFGWILVTNHQSVEKEAERITEKVGDQSTGIEDYEEVREHAAELAEQGKQTDDEDAGDSGESSDDTEETAETEKEDATAVDQEEPLEETSADTVKEPAGIVCWGDDLINGDASSTTSYMAVLEKLLAENGYDLPVINKTIQGGGTLSMMTMAGVSSDVVQGYITKHQQAAGGAQLNVTETGIRDLTEEQTARNDLECIPVIFMGYYGGWNHDPAELAEQQENILNTFPDKERFIIAGTRPVDGTVSADALDQAMSAKWGEHYISLAAVTSEPAASAGGQEALAKAVLQKLEELEYISKG